MTKTILASLTGFGSDNTVLDTAVAAARIEGGHIECLHANIDAYMAAAKVGAMAPQPVSSLYELREELAHQEQGKSEHAKAAFEDACKRHALAVGGDPEIAGEVSASWREITAVSDETLHLARHHDLIVMGRDGQVSSDQMQTILMQSGRPVLLAPAMPVAVIGRAVAIAWKDRPDAARALTAAAGILSRAERIAVLSVSADAAEEDTDRASAGQLAKQLRRKGIEADVKVKYSPSPAKAIEEMAGAFAADLLVMGAYGHSRLREFVFGGVTRDILADCAIPVFMFH